MTTYNVWVGGEHSWNRSYMGELGYYPLNEAQIKRWITDDLDTGVLSERMHRDDDEPDGEDDFPHRYEVENGCLGYGAYTDQTYGVEKELEDGEDKTIWKGEYRDLVDHDDTDCKEIAPRRHVTYEEPGCKEGEEIGVAYEHTFKGGWSIPVELPDDEEFDITKLTFVVTSVEGLGDIVTSIVYNGEDYFEDGSSDGKSCDWYLVQGGDFESL